MFVQHNNVEWTPKAVPSRMVLFKTTWHSYRSTDAILLIKYIGMQGTVLVDIFDTHGII